MKGLCKGYIVSKFKKFPVSQFCFLGVEGFWNPPLIGDPLELETQFLAGLEGPEVWFHIVRGDWCIPEKFRSGGFFVPRIFSGVAFMYVG